MLLSTALVSCGSGTEESKSLSSEKVERSTSSESSSIEGIDDDDDDDDNDYSSSSSSSEDWDALLNSYEQYADEYISLMKKDEKV